MALAQISQLVGRIMIGGIYLASGISKIPEWTPTLQAMRAEGMPLPELFLVGAIVLLIGGGLSVVVGWRARAGAIALAVFTVPAMLIFNHFWTMSPPRAEDIMHLFLANIVMLRACLFIAGNGPGVCSLDARS